MNERRLFGEIAISEGFLTKDQLLQALNRQVKLRRQGKGHKLLGVLLVEMGLLTPEQVFEVLQVFEDEEMAAAATPQGVRAVSVGAASGGADTVGAVTTERVIESVDALPDTLPMDANPTEGPVATG